MNGTYQMRADWATVAYVPKDIKIEKSIRLESQDLESRLGQIDANRTWYGSGFQRNLDQARYPPLLHLGTRGTSPIRINVA